MALITIAANPQQWVKHRVIQVVAHLLTVAFRLLVVEIAVMTAPSGGAPWEVQVRTSHNLTIPLEQVPAPEIGNLSVVCECSAQIVLLPKRKHMLAQGTANQSHFVFSIC